MSEVRGKASLECRRAHTCSLNSEKFPEPLNEPCITAANSLQRQLVPPPNPEARGPLGKFLDLHLALGFAMCVVALSSNNYKKIFTVSFPQRCIRLR